MLNEHEEKLVADLDAYFTGQYVTEHTRPLISLDAVGIIRDSGASDEYKNFIQGRVDAFIEQNLHPQPHVMHSQDIP